MFRPPRRRQRRRKEEKTRSETPEGGLGQFVNFPSMIHGAARISHGNPLVRLQSAVIQTFFALNEFRDRYQVSVADHAGTYNGEIAFEVGVADGLFFDYLGGKILQRLLKALESKGGYTILDFIIIVAYRYLRGGRKIALNFDHYLLRFSFYNKEFDVSLFHSKGTRRMPLDEFMNMIFARLNTEVEKVGLKSMRVESMKTL